MNAHDQTSVLLMERRNALYTSRSEIGVDFVEVREKKGAEGVWELRVNFVPAHATAARKFSALENISASNLVLRDAAGAQSRELRVVPGTVRVVRGGDDASKTARRRAGAESSLPALALEVRAADAAAFRRSAAYSATYTLELVNVPHVDRFFTSAAFSFRRGASEIDPRRPPESDVSTIRVAEIDYLSKDYASFRRLMLDRLSLLSPGWGERRAADLGIALVEVMAYAADYLSYYQDGVATEAYLTTARRRVSLRRHARLLDYLPADGCNARTWVHFEVSSATPVRLEQGAKLLTAVNGFGTVIPPDSFAEATDADPLIFETMYAADLYPPHNRIALYTWGAAEYVLEEGATAAALEGHFPDLVAGDVLIIEQTTETEADGARPRGHPVRLSENPEATADPLYDDRHVTLIRWHDEDALPFALNVSATPAGPSAVVLGNNVLADHGNTLARELLPPAPFAGSYYPKLHFTDPTFAVPFDEKAAGKRSARAALARSAGGAVPSVRLSEVVNENPAGAVGFKDETYWDARRDLLGSGPGAREFVVETEQDGSARLRFGDGRYGARPTPGQSFVAVYRVGKGQAGNVGPDTLRHLVGEDERFVSLRNPVAASGGADPETLDQIRLKAPQAFRRLKRCVTEADYVTVAEDYRDVLKAVAKTYWTGSWATVFVYVQRKGGRAVGDEYRARLLAHLDQFRLIGHDLEVAGARYVPLEIALAVRVDRRYSKNAALSRLNELFSNVTTPGGGRGFFYPDNFTLGQPVYLSQIVAAAMRVPGVTRVEANRFRRLGGPHGGADEAVSEQLEVGPLEVARLDNDPAAPENGVITFDVRDAP